MLLVVFGSVPLIAKADCTFTSPSKTETITISPPATLSLPRDKTGSLFVSSFVSPSGNSRFTCSTKESVGVSNRTGGAQPGTNELNMPIGTTGLFWRWRFIAPGQSAQGALSSFGTRSVAAGTTNNLDGRSYALELFSPTPVAAGTVIPAGTYGSYEAGTLKLLEIKLANSITISSRTCTTPDVAVPMATNKASDFPATGTGPSSKGRIRFTLNINDCPAEIKSVKYQFNVDTGNIVDETNGVIKLSNPDAIGTSQGVGLQLRDSDGAALKFNTFIPVVEYVAAPVGGTSSYQVNLDAGYFKIRATAATPGTANATMKFTMSYQ